MPAPPERFWPHTDEYPKGSSFGELLDWHLIYWGTRPPGAKDEKGKKGESWQIWEFAALVHGKSTVSRDGGDFDSESKNVRHWRQGKHHPANDSKYGDVRGRILRAFFDDNESLRDWKIDLEGALSRPLELSPLIKSGSSYLAGGADFKQSPVVTPAERIVVNHTEQSSPFRAKIDFLRYNISASKLAKIEETKDRWLARFEPSMIAAALGYEINTFQPASISALVDQRMSGMRPMKPRERLALAEHFALIGHAPNRSAAAELLADEVTFDKFASELVASGWANQELIRPGRMKSRQLIFEAFKPFGLWSGGLLVGDDSTISSARQGQTRGMEVPQPGDTGDLHTITLDTKVGLIVEKLTSPRGLLVLEIAPSQNDGEHSVTCLVPSIMAPSCTVMPDQMLPTMTVNGVNRFIARKPTGRYDWLAILTSEPLVPIWQNINSDLHRLSDIELEWLLNALDEQMRHRDSAITLEVRHHAFRIEEKAG